MRYIELSQGLRAAVDDEDWVWLCARKWSASLSPTSGRYYAVRVESRKGLQRVIRMHRAILKAPPGMQVDHVDGDGLNNTRANLRLCTGSLNLCNRGPRTDNKSGVKGVFLDKRRGTWVAHAQLYGESVRRSGFKTLEEAAEFIQKARKELHGEFARSSW